MSESLEKRAEVAKLARLLGRAPEELAYLAEVPAADLRELREQITETLFSAGAGALGRLAAASKLLPVGLVATMAERVFGPVLSARIATRIDPERAVQMAEKLPTAFVADIAIELDPRRAHEIIARIPAEQIAEVSRELVRRGEYVTMGRFVGHLSPRAIAAAVKTMDDVAVLQIAFVLENKESFGDLLDLLTDARLEHVIETATREDLWPETLDLLTTLTDDRRERVIAIAATREDEVLDALIATAHGEGLWTIVLPLTGLMTPASLTRFAALGSLQASGVLERIVDTAVAHEDLWVVLVPMISQLPARCQTRVVTHATKLGVAGRLGEFGYSLSTSTAA